MCVVRRRELRGRPRRVRGRVPRRVCRRRSGGHQGGMGDNTKNAGLVSTPGTRRGVALWPNTMPHGICTRLRPFPTGVGPHRARTGVCNDFAHWPGPVCAAAPSESPPLSLPFPSLSPPPLLPVAVLGTRYHHTHPAGPVPHLRHRTGRCPRTSLHATRRVRSGVRAVATVEVGWLAGGLVAGQQERAGGAHTR